MFFPYVPAVVVKHFLITTQDKKYLLLCHPIHNTYAFKNIYTHRRLYTYIDYTSVHISIIKTKVSQDKYFFLFFVKHCVIFCTHILLFKTFCPGWCSSADWVWACEPKGHWLESQSGHMPVLWAGSPVGGAQEATTQWGVSPSFSFPPLSLKINKI